MPRKKNIVTTPEGVTIIVKERFRKSDLVGWLFCAPMIFGILVFTLYPMIQALINSFARVNGMNIEKWLGLENYTYIFKDAAFVQSIGNTLFMAIFSVLSTMVLSFLAATLINSVKVGKGLFKALYFLPNVVSVVAASILFNFLLYPTKGGLLNYALGIFGAAPISWFGDPRVARFSMVIMGTWFSIGYDSLLFLAGLQGVSRELYEAAEVDGASAFRRWWHVTIPACRPTFIFVFVMKTISSMNRFGDVYMVGGLAGAPSGSLMTMVLYIYRTAIFGKDIGKGCAAAYVLFAITLTLTAINQYVTSKWSD